MSEQLAWTDLARVTIEKLCKYDNEHHTWYAYYLDDDDMAIEILAQCLSQANTSLYWKPVLPQKKDEKHA